MTVDIDTLALEQQVCFALAVTNRAVLSIYRPLLEPLGLTHPQYLVMLALWDHQKESTDDDAPLSVKQIAATLQLDSATLSPMLKRLQTLGLIARNRSTADERSTQIELTDDGRALRERALAIPAAVVARLGVDLAELDELRQRLTSINSAALAAGALNL
jgi:MarR family transcriptional regulator, organic hydroperoxide resistance regulator